VTLGSPRLRTAILLVPVVLSLLVLAAHFLRAGNTLLVALVLATIALLAVRRGWAARAIQVVLVLGAVEWTRTLLRLASERSAAGQPYLRMVLILGGVTIATAMSAAVFRSDRLRQWFNPAR
jgi:hypothetical protein